ncbi:MAG: hypothetical protein J6K96_03470 [Treponema sp.]|nr:hypothetical protein [Treponema sp.]
MGNKNKKVPPIVIKQPIVPIIDREPDIADVPAAALAFEDMEENPIFIETEHENLINGEKPGTAAAAALADTEQNPILIKTEADSLIAGEQPGIDLKNLGIGTLAGAVKPVVDPKPKPKSTGGNSAGNDFQP